MIDLAFVESLIRALDESGLDTLEVGAGGDPGPPLQESACGAIKRHRPTSTRPWWRIRWGRTRHPS